MTKYSEYIKNTQRPIDLCREIDTLRAEKEKLTETLNNREKFIDYVINKHPEITSEYLEGKNE